MTDMGKKKKSALISALLSLAVMILLVPTAFRSIFSIPAQKDLIFSVTATGEKADQSFGNEVRIKAITVNGQEIDLQAYDEADGNWQNDQGVLAVYNAEQPAGVKWNLKGVEELEIQMIAQRGSGYAEIRYDDVSERIDLYRDADWDMVQRTYKMGERFAPQLRLDLLIEMWLIVFGGCFVGIYARMKKPGADDNRKT